MKKILSGLILASLLAVLMVPAVVSGQAEPVSCCKAGKEIKWTTGRVNDVSCTPAAPCTISAGNDIGSKDSICVDAAAPESKTEQWGIICLINGINSVVDWIFVILIVGIVLLILYGASLIVMAGGTAEKVTAGRQWISWALIGLAVALFAKAIPAIVKALIGM